MHTCIHLLFFNFRCLQIVNANRDRELLFKNSCLNKAKQQSLPLHKRDSK